MKKIVWFLIVLIIIVVVITISAKVFKKNQAEEGTSASLVAQVVEPQVSVDDAADNIKDIYKQDPEFAQCFSQTVESCLSQVINTKMRTATDATLCDDFLTEPQKDACRFGFHMRAASESGDIAGCDAIAEENQKNSCRQSVAGSIAVAKQDLSVCDALEEVTKEQCRTRSAGQLAQQTGQASWCDQIGDEREKQQCQQEVELFAQFNRDTAPTPVAQPTPLTQEASTEQTVSATEDSATVPAQ